MTKLNQYNRKSEPKINFSRFFEIIKKIEKLMNFVKKFFEKILLMFSLCFI